LRFAIYKEPTIASALNELNRILAENGLVHGFATLFAGCYDSKTNELRYVNCGQEPGLLWRPATSELLYLEATGPILGAFKNSTYDEITVEIDSGNPPGDEGEFADAIHQLIADFYDCQKRSVQVIKTAKGVKAVWPREDEEV